MVRMIERPGAGRRESIQPSSNWLAFVEAAARSGLQEATMSDRVCLKCSGLISLVAGRDVPLGSGARLEPGGGEVGFPG